MSRPSALPEWATDANYPAGTDPWSSTATRIDPTAGERAAGFVPQEAVPAQYLNKLFGEAADWITYLDGIIASVFGDGSDGAAALDGTNTFGWASKSGSHYTLTRDIYVTSMTFTNSAYLTTAGYRIFCRGAIDTTATALSGGVIENSGANASAGTGGAGGAAGSVGGGGAGGSEAFGTGGDGGDMTHSLGGAGGDGSAPPAGGDGGTVTAPTATGYKPFLFAPPTFGYVFGVTGGAAVVQLVSGGGGGGGGYHLFGGTGGAGGGGGGVVAIAAHTLDLKSAADIKAAGGNGSALSGEAGHGGGGGGGVVILVYCASSHSFSASTNCPGGTKGGGTAVDGSNGSVHVLDLGSSGGVATLTANKQQRGKEIIATADTVAITFAASFAYGTATGASGYRIKTLSVYCSDGGDPVGATVTAKTTTGFTVTFDRVFTGELDWETEGSL